MDKSARMSKTITDDIVRLSDNVIVKIVQEVIQENKDLFKDKTYLNLKNDKSIYTSIVANEVFVSLDININYSDNINQLVDVLQKDIKLMIEHITEYSVEDVSIKVVGVKS